MGANSGQQVAPNGVDLHKVIVNRSDLPIIFITGYGDVPDEGAAMKAGAAEFLTKPFADEVLRQAIRQAIELSRENSVRRRNRMNSGIVTHH